MDIRNYTWVNSFESGNTASTTAKTVPRASASAATKTPNQYKIYQSR